jgi:hypothetical protein
MARRGRRGEWEGGAVAVGEEIRYGVVGAAWAPALCCGALCVRERRKKERARMLTGGPAKNHFPNFNKSKFRFGSGNK